MNYFLILVVATIINISTSKTCIKLKKNQMYTEIIQLQQCTSYVVNEQFATCTFKTIDSSVYMKISDIPFRVNGIKNYAVSYSLTEQIQRKHTKGIRTFNRMTFVENLMNSVNKCINETSEFLKMEVSPTIHNGNMTVTISCNYISSPCYKDADHLHENIKKSMNEMLDIQTLLMYYDIYMCIFLTLLLILGVTLSIAYVKQCIYFHSVTDVMYRYCIKNDGKIKYIPENVQSDDEDGHTFTTFLSNETINKSYLEYLNNEQLYSTKV